MSAMGDVLRRHGVDADRVAPKLYVGSYNENDALLTKLGISYVVRVAKELPRCDFPLDDSHDVGLAFRETSARAAADAIRALGRGHRVLITCQMGINRSAFVAALVMIHWHGWTPETVIAEIRAQRVVPVAGMRALSNTSFERLLRAQSVKRAG